MTAPADPPTFVDPEALACRRIQGVDVELDHIRPAGWSIEFRSADSVLRTATDDWRAAVSEMWSVVRFVAYGDFSRLRRDVGAVDIRRYPLVTASRSGLCFRVWFEIHPPAMDPAG